MKNSVLVKTGLVLLITMMYFSCSPAFAAIDVIMQLNNRAFVSYDHFKAGLILNNHGAPVPDAQIFGILDIFGVYYFWPEFTTDVGFETRSIETGEMYILFLEFDFPDIDDAIPFGPMNFWGAWFKDMDNYGFDVMEFWLDQEHKWTPTPTPTPTYHQSTSTPTPAGTAQYTSTPIPSSTPQTPTATPTPAGTSHYTNTPTYTPMPPTFTPSPTATFTQQNFVLIPAGDFMMGSPESEMCRGLETLHNVTLTRSFYMQETEVTQQQWVDIFGTNPAYNPGMNHPIENISWYDACIYCNRISLVAGLTPCYYSDPDFSIVFDGTPPVISGDVYWMQTANGYRLPTEAEWEYACRAGTSTAYNSGQDNTSCYGEDPHLNPLGWYRENTGTEPSDVGLKQANAWGLFDMHGNVWEFCWDWFDDYPPGSAEDPTGPDEPTGGSYRLERGGSWVSWAQHCRSACRNGTPPQSRDNSLGFRPVRWSD